MPPDPSALGTPQEWLNRAKSNLAIASQAKTENIYWEDLCFEVQQAAEKALKAVMLAKGIRFRFVHDLSEHLTLLEQSGLSLPEEVRNAAILTDFAVEARYPGVYEPITETEFRESLRIATAVIVWAETQM